ncbi:MAG: prepilin-type N-terminal cleavage/methylation protein [Steroidobacteraceae bacterium]|jgi:type IV fimbrial biogenesis protein FimT|nr:prepilin-type N-terminal cleavage/methylation protein [Steroidobacteraceae bacterium]
MNRNAGFARRYRGFTLMELMLSIAVLGILTALAVPSFTTMINRNRLASQSNELLAAIQYARMEAIRISGRVTFCGADSVDAAEDADCSEGEHNFWVVLGSTSGGGQEQLRVFEVEQPLKVSTDLEQVTFNADGLAREPGTQTLVTGSITVCLETTRPAQNKRVLNIASGSRVAVTTPEESGGGVCE